MDQSSLRVLGNSLSKSLAADLKNSRGRKTLSLHNFSASEDVRLEKDSEVTGSSSFFNKDEPSSASLSCSAMKRELQPQTSSFNSKRPRFNVTSFGPSLLEARKSVLASTDFRIDRIYIRSIPEPILIENVRSTSKRQINAELIRNFDQDGSIEQKKMTKTISEKGDVTPVLPAVLHMAAPSIHTDGLPKPQTSTPVWYRGKISKLLDRNVTPTVFKHKGRVQVSKYSINSTYSPQKVQPPKSNGSEDCKFSMMDVSVLENVTREAAKWTCRK